MPRIRLTKSAIDALPNLKQTPFTGTLVFPALA